MIISELKPMEEILGYLKEERKIFLLGCKGCAEACETGSEKQVLEMKKALEKEGKTITGWDVIDFLCDKALVKTRLYPKEAKVRDADSLLVMTCGIGVQAVAASVDKVAHPAANTISVGGARGTWPSTERCAQCGDCLLDYTGGICPVTSCSKSLINGMCGGQSEGKCEVRKDIDCGWLKIYERLKKLGRLERLKEFVPPKKQDKYIPPAELKKTVFWAYDQEIGRD